MPGPTRNFIDPATGKSLSVPDEQVAAVRFMGWREEDPSEASARTTREIVAEENSGFDDKALAAVSGLARGATFGLSDLAYSLTSPGSSVERLARVREANPITSTATEITGAFLPGVLSGGAGAAGAVARFTPAGGTAALSSRIATSGSGRGILGRVVSGAAGAAVEGSAQQAGMYLSSVVLDENKKLSAEAWLAEAGKGALLGGAIGGVLSAAERGFVAAKRIVPKHVATEKAVKQAAENVDAEVTKALNVEVKIKQKVRDQLELIRLQDAELESAARALALEKKTAAAVAKAESQAAIAAEKAAQAEQKTALGAQKIATQAELDAIRIAKAKAPPRKRGRPSAADKAKEAAPAQTAEAIPETGAAGDDLEGLLRQSADRFDSGETMAKLADDARVPEPTMDEIHEAMAEIDPVSKKLVDQMRAVEAAGDEIRRKFTIKDRFGTHKVTIPELEPMTVGRIKQAYLAADDAEKAAILETVGAQKAKALTDIVKSEEDFARWFAGAADDERAAILDVVGHAKKRTRTPRDVQWRLTDWYKGADDAERATLMSKMSPERASELTQLADDSKRFSDWFKNRDHWYEDPSYVRSLAAKERVAVPEDIDAIVPGVIPGASGPVPGLDDLERMLASDKIDLEEMFKTFSEREASGLAREMDDLAHMERMAKDLADYERTIHEATQTLGENAPTEAVEFSSRYASAVDDQQRKATTRLAQSLDDAPDPVFAEGSGPVPTPKTPLQTSAPVDEVAASPGIPPRTSARELADEAAKADDAARAADTISTPGAEPTQPSKARGAIGALQDFGAFVEGLQFAGVNLPFMPDVDKIPVIGPIVGTYLKLRALAMGARKFGVNIPGFGEAQVAAGAAAARDRMSSAVDSLLSSGAQGAHRARSASQAAPHAFEVLKDRIYDDGERKEPKTAQEAVIARSEELLAAKSNPAGVRSAIRQRLKDVSDPDFVDAAVSAAQRKVDYLSKHAPILPPQGFLSKANYQHSSATVERFARRVRAANDPSSVLRDINNGFVTPEAADTLRELYPEMFQEARGMLYERAQKLRNSLHHGKVVRLSVLFQAPLSASLEPGHAVSSLSISPAQQQQPPQPPPQSGMMAPPPAGAPNISNLLMTDSEKRAAARG